MRRLFRGGQVWENDAFVPMDILSCDGVVAAKAPDLANCEADEVYDLTGLAIFPGFADVHVHLREPGFSYKQTIASGSKACAHGGYTTVCAMPNLNPVPDSDEGLAAQEEIIRRDAVIDVRPYGSITIGRKGCGETVDFAALASRVCGFSDDGTGVCDEAVMEKAMREIAGCNSLLAAHCEDLTLIPKGGAIHDGPFAHEHGIPGIPSASEWVPIARDLELARKTGCRYHVCHISCRESVELIRKAKAAGVDVTCETGPHYLLLCQDDLQDLGRFKMNPPLRSADDRAALLEGLLDGTIDMIATDHAPHSAEEKSRGLAGSAMGVVGIETAFPLLYTWLVEIGKVPLTRIVDALTRAPKHRFGIDGGLDVGQKCTLCAFDLNTEETILPEHFLSMGKATPFENWKVHAVCRLTVCGDRIAYQEMKA